MIWMRVRAGCYRAAGYEINGRTGYWRGGGNSMHRTLAEAKKAADDHAARWLAVPCLGRSEKLFEELEEEVLAGAESDNGSL